MAASAVLVLGIASVIGFFSSPAAAAVLTKNDKVDICHHDNGAKVYNAISPNVDSIVKPNGHDGHSDDIIPAFDYDLGKGAGVQHYPGKNLALLSTLNNGCVAPAGGPANPTHVAPGTPGTTSSVCAGNPSGPTAPGYTVPTTPGITYSPAVGGTATPGSVVDITATANPGYVIDVNGVTSPSVVLHVTIPPLATGCTTNVIVVPPTPPTPPSGAPAPGTPGTVDNLGISKTGTGTAKPGDELVWTLSVRNVAGTPASGFTVTDALPAGLTFSSAEGQDYNCSAAAQVVTCTYAGSLAVGQNADVTVRALLGADYQGAFVSNTAVVDPGRADSDPSDNSSTTVTTVTQPAPAEFTGGGGGATVTPPAAGGGAALPFTGANTLGVAQAGALLVLLGSIIIVACRRPEQAE